MSTSKTILITGASDGIGRETATALVAQGHRLLLHGRNPDKLARVIDELRERSAGADIESFTADLSVLAEVRRLALTVAERHKHLDVLINNAGVYKLPEPQTVDGLDARFVVNCIAPYCLTRDLMPLFGSASRVINLCSAAQAPVDLDALAGRTRLTDDFDAYAQSKLALTMWSRSLGLQHKADGPAVIAVNPGSLLGSKMVREGFGVAGKDLRIGVDILLRAALDDAFASRSGEYFDNDVGAFSAPQEASLDPARTGELIREIERTLAK